MSKKIKITEEQLQMLLKQREVNEDTFHINQSGDYTSGEGPMPEPMEMAEIVSRQIKLHPDYFKIENAGALEEFFDALREIITINNEEDTFFPDARQLRDLKVSDYQMNEQSDGDQNQKISNLNNSKIRTFDDIIKSVEKNDTEIGEPSSVENDDYDEYQDRHMGLSDIDEISNQDLPLTESVQKIKTLFKRLI